MVIDVDGEARAGVIYGDGGLGLSKRRGEVLAVEVISAEVELHEVVPARAELVLFHDAPSVVIEIAYAGATKRGASAPDELTKIELCLNRLRRGRRFEMAVVVVATRAMARVLGVVATASVAGGHGWLRGQEAVSRRREAESS